MSWLPDSHSRVPQGNFEISWSIKRIQLGVVVHTCRRTDESSRPTHEESPCLKNQK